MNEHSNTGTPGDRVAAARRRLKRLKLASVATSVIGFGALSASIAAHAAATPIVTSTAATAGSAAVSVSSSTTSSATTTVSPAATATPTVTQSTAPIVSAQS